MNAYRFVGSACVLWGIAEFSTFGQRIELPEHTASEAIRGGAALVPEEEFEAIGFTADELKNFAFPGQQVNAPEPFKTKQRAAILAYQTRRHELQAERARQLAGGND